MIKLDQWQEQVLGTKGNICVRSSRQAGKSTIVSIKAADFAANNPNKTILVIASVERQSYLLFEKILNYMYEKHKKKIKRGTDRPTKHKLNLTNGSVIYSLPTGTSGYGIRGFTIDLLIADEAAYIPEDVWTAVVPMLAVTKGDIWLLSTPKGKEGYFYKCFTDENFTQFHVSALDCPRISKEFLEQEKKRMTKLQFTQEYLAEFSDQLRQFFPTELIKKVMTLQRGSGFGFNLPMPLVPVGEYFMGVDVARLGKDETVMASLKRHKERLRMVDMEITTKTYTTETVNKILILDKSYNYKKIYIDDGGMGVAVFDPLLVHEQTRNKVVALNNASRPLVRDETRKKRILKEDLYNNLLRVMEQGKIEVFDEPEIFLSLSSVQYDYKEDGRLIIFGNYTHIAEALIRAAWCMAEKSLNVWCR